ncbi:MAG: endonuclease YncB(thermonuclease family), partial [Lentimonas sp.]
QYSVLFQDLNKLILATKNKIEQFARHQLILTYWQVGQRINAENLTQNANYSSLIVNKLSEDLVIDKDTLGRSIKFFKFYPEKPPEESSLTWSHYKYLLTINNEEKRTEIEEKAKEEGWNVSKTNIEVKNLKTNQIQSNSTIIRPVKANYLYKAKIINVVDGDTLLLNIDLGFSVIKEQRVRLAAIDAPEIKSSAGKESLGYLRDLAANLDWIVVRTNKIDIFGRYIGDVFYPKTNGQRWSKIEVFENGVYLNEQIVADGFAEVF